ncbi:hypothetical protein ZWY2020_009660 [Hordeum vulgare]|nr:hypothetical protein ZWY2020_009660 [Hordeum vulgare]
MASTACHPEALTTTLLTLPLELPVAADLAHAFMASVSIRRVVTDHRFLHRFRTHHPPPLLGILSPRCIPNQLLLQLAQPLHPFVAAASTFAEFHTADFSCSFLPSPSAAAGVICGTFASSSPASQRGADLAASPWSGTWLSVTHCTVATSCYLPSPTTRPH